MKRISKMLLLFLVINFPITFFTGCIQSEENVKLPAIKVVFTHYIVDGQHILEIKNVSAVWITKSEAPKLYTSPPFPGIHVYALYSSGYTPVTYLPVTTEGDKIVAYVGFESPKKLPKQRELVIVAVDIVDENGRTIATTHKPLLWNLKT